MSQESEVNEIYETEKRSMSSINVFRIQLPDERTFQIF